MEITLNSLLENNDVARLDAEYSGKAVLAAISRLREIGSMRLGDMASITDGIHESLPFVEDGEVKVFSAKHPKDNYIDRSGFETITLSYHASNPRTALQAGDVLLSTVGTIGNSAVVTPDLLPANSDRHIGIIRLKNLSPYFVSSFLVSKYGRIQSLREATGNVQLNLFISKIAEILLPRFSGNLESAIAALAIAGYKERDLAAARFEQASLKLLNTLGLENWQPPNPLTYTRSSTDAFAAGRFDAEYFYPAKVAAQAYLNALPGKTIGSMFNSVRELWQPENAPANQLVRNYDLNDALSPFLDDAKEPSYPAEISSTKKRIQKGDIVVSRLRSYLKEIAVVQADSKEPLVGSTEFIVLRPKTEAIPVEALLVFLRSTLPQLIFQWSQDGSNHPRFDEKELLNLHVPDVVSAISRELTDRVNAATSARRRAKELLKAAKRAVEIAIEDSETAALAYLADFS